MDIVECSEACKECSGPGNDLCISCNERMGFYPLYSKQSTCLFLCNYELDKPLYLNPDKMLCESCNNHCALCFGPSNMECNKCNSPYYLGNHKECIYTECNNYPNTFPSNFICENCDPMCDGCFHSPTKCLACAFPFLYLKETSLCLTSCPLSYYSYHLAQLCLRNIYIYILYIACPQLCEECEMIIPHNISTDNLFCTYCSRNYFLQRENNICAKGNECDLNTYPEPKTRTCNLCNIACQECLGPHNFECIVCNENFVLSSQGICEEIICPVGYYLENLKCKRNS